MHECICRALRWFRLIEKAAAAGAGRRGSRGPVRRHPEPYAIEALEQRVLLSAYTMSTIGSFGTNQTGERPMSGPTIDAAGNLYATTSLGGAFGRGTIFEIAHGSSTITTLASFPQGFGSVSSGYGSEPAPLVRDQSGNLYGLAGDKIFELPAGSSTIDLLASFGPALPSPASFQRLVLDPNGNIYGIFRGNLSGVFELPHGSSAITVLANFNGSTIGYQPNALVEDGSGNLFGTTQTGGTGHAGTLYEIPYNSSTATPLVSFDGGTLGGNPFGLVFDGSGNLFGVTEFGGATQYGGTVFELPHSGSSILTLAQNGGSPSELDMDQSGNIYFSWSEDFNGFDTGAVLEISHVNYTSTTVASFKGEDGPQGIAVDGAGDIFGVTTAGGPYGNGTVFRIASGSNTVSTIATFGYVLGSDALTTPTVDSGGNLFGMTAAQQVPGGDYGTLGGVFDVSAGASSPTMAASFFGSPVGKPLLDGNGNLYGTSEYGNGIFELPQGSSTIKTLASFTGTSISMVPGALAVDGAGNVYGAGYGTNYDGCIFEVPHGSSSVVILASFDGTNGADPTGVVIEGAGNLYGTTESGGTGGYGTIFELPHGGSAIISLASGSFGTDTSPVVLDGSGNIFTIGSGGTVYELARGSSAITALATVGPTVPVVTYLPVQSMPAPVLDSRGDLFLTVYNGGANKDGAVIEIPQGTSAAVTVFSFNGDDGSAPTGLAIDAAGNLYGTTTAGGPAGSGTIFKLTPTPIIDVINAPVGSAPITLTRDPDGQHIDWTMGSTLGLVAINDPAGLTINGGSANGTIFLDNTNGNPLPNTIHLNGTFTVDGMSGTNPLAGTTLDIGGGTDYLVYPVPSSALFASIRSDLLNGFSNGTWTGTPTSTLGVITSSAAANAPGRLAVGYANAVDGTGIDTVSSTIELKTTLIGDTNLDGTVNLADLLALTRNFGHTNASWDQGDLNYDGSVNLSDFLALARNFGKTNIVNPLLVTSTADDGSLGTLRYAITHSNPGDTISFSPGVFAAGSSHTITLATGELELTHNLTIAGPGAANLSISGNNASRVFQVDAGVTANLSGLTITGGNAGAGNAGGGISNSGTLDLSSVVITANAAGFGGGIYTQGVANLTGCTLSNNSASTNGGGMDTHTSATLIGCTVNNNRTASGSGGGVLDNGGTVTLINDTITANSDAGGSGGGVANVQSGTLTIADCTIAANSAASAGAGVYLASGSITINNTVVAQDTYLNSSTPNDVSGTLAGSYNLIGDGSGGLTSANHNLLGKPSSLLDPKLGILSNNGGPTLTMLPQTGSTLIDAGSNVLVPTGTATDRRGYVRIANGTVDIGACESNSTAALAPILGPSAAAPSPSRTLAARRIR